MRKLATAALAFSAAIFLANYILPAGWLIVPAVLAAALGAALSLFHRKWLRGAVIALVFFALGLLEFSVYSRLTVERAEAHVGQTREITGVVLDYPDVYAGYCRLRVRVDAPDLPPVKAVVYDNRKLFASAEPGQRLRFTAKISAADTLYGRPYDNYRVDGFFWKLSIKGGEELTEGGFSLFALPVRLNKLLRDRVDRFFPQSCRAFVKALMLGDKRDFYADDALYVAMSRSGLMHIAAVSGLHIAFLVGFLCLLFGNGRRGALTSIALVWAFVLVTGMSKSAARAAIMQSFLLLAPILRRENDPVTSLSAALALILALNPFSAKSVSLQMSFAAMAGIVCFGQRLYDFFLRSLPESARGGPLVYPLGIAASSLSVMVFTTPLTALHFSYVPLLSLLSNLACLWAVSLCFCLAWAACLLSPVPVLGAGLVQACAGLARFILFVAGRVAGLPHAVLYMETDGALGWMLATYALLVLGFLIRKRTWLRLLLPGGLSLALLVGLLWRTERFYRETDCLSVLNVGQGQCIAALAGNATAVVDCGNINTLDDAGALAGEYLLGRGRKSVELLILTHLHADHADGAIRLMELLPVDTLMLPADAEDEGGLRDRILACAERHGTKVVNVEHDTEARVGRIAAKLYKLTDSGDENERCLCVKLSIGETDLLTTADAPKKLERALAAQEDLSGIEILVAGHHGSKYAGAKELLEEAGGKLAVVSVGYNTYGHPAQESLDTLAQYGYRVMRTDTDGTVEIHLEKNHG